MQVSNVWKLLLTLAVAGAFLAAALPLYAQTSTVTAEVDNADPTLYDIVTLTITVSGDNNISAPSLPTLSGLQMIGTKIESKQTFRNGKITAEFKFIVQIRPRHTGAIQIGAVKVPIGGDIYETSPITLNVTQGTPPTPTPLPFRPANSFPRLQPPQNQGVSSSQDDSFFIQSEVDNENPYLGEQITYTSKFYSSTSYFIRPIQRSPDFAGFWNPGREDRREYPDMVEGVGYSVTESSVILFPTIAGDITIEPATVGVPGRSISGSFRQYVSQPVQLRVRPLPMNEPASFTGAVGKYEIAASLNTDSIELGESLTLTITIEGQGNFDTLPDPVWQDIPEWRAFENDSFHRSFVQNGVINGSKTFERVLAPNEAGDFELPPIEYSYFDPDLEEYITVSTNAFAVRVKPDPDAAVEPEPTINEDGSPAVTDIRHIKPAPRGIGAPSNPTQVSPFIWGVGVLPVAALAALAAWRWIVARREAALRANAPIRARQLALSRLTELDSSASGADAAAAALRGYLSAALGRTSSSLAASELKELLRERGATEETIQVLGETLSALDQQRFAPQEMVTEDDSGKAVAEIVSRIEWEIGR